MDWREEAERLKFDEGLSWSELSKRMTVYFPELNERQIFEKVRGVLRNSDRYHQPTKVSGKQTHFYYESKEDVHVYIIGDVHCGAHGFQRKLFEAYISKIALDDKAVVIVNGDLIDNATQGSKGCVFSQKMSPQNQIEDIISMLSPIADKIIFFCIGNHEERTFRQTGNDPGYTMCLGLNCLDKYNYVHGFIKIKAKGKIYKIYATHNIGSGDARIKSICGAHPDCDILIGGHTHTPHVVPAASELFDGKLKTQYGVVGTAWLRDESYSISAAYRTVSILPPVIELGENIRIYQ